VPAQAPKPSVYWQWLISSPASPTLRPSLARQNDAIRASEPARRQDRHRRHLRPRRPRVEALPARACLCAQGVFSGGRTGWPDGLTGLIPPYPLSQPFHNPSTHLSHLSFSLHPSVLLINENAAKDARARRRRERSGHSGHQATSYIPPLRVLTASKPSRSVISCRT
jgi:hypothetical protein